MSSYSTQNPQSATIKLVSKQTSRTVPCLYEEMQGKRLVLEADEPLSASQAVTVEYSDALFLGEVVKCVSIDPFLWRVEVEVEQILTGLQSLMALRSRLLGESMPQPLRIVPTEAAA